MTDAIEGEVLPTGRVQTTDELDPAAVELGRTDRKGRPTAMTPDVINRLILAFNNAYNITEACDFAGISRPTYYDWMEKDPSFSYKMSEAQRMVGRKAKENVVKALNDGDPNISLRYLMLRDPDFKPKVKNETDPDLDKTRSKLKDFLDDTSDQHDGGGEPAAAADTEPRGEVAQAPTDIS